MNILLAENQKKMAKIIAKYFEKEGFTVHVCHDGKAALKTFYNHTFDVAILDWMMPLRK